jgi:hypothetical protein
MSLSKNSGVVLSALLLAAASTHVCSSIARAGGHFDAVDPNYTSEIYAGPIQGGCGAWTLSGHLLLRAGNTIFEYDPTNTSVHQGTNVHNLIATHVVPGLDNPASGGVSMTNGNDGFLYMGGPSGLQRVNPNTWGPAVTLPGSVSGQGYGINTLPDGKLVYADGNGASQVYVYDPVNNVNQHIYSAGYLVDDIETGPATAVHPNGVIALAGQSNSSIEILTSTGTVINSFSTPHFPDGLAFGDGPFGNSVYANNNDGSITRYDFGGGNYTGAVTPVDIALTLPGHHGYGDLATVGPDCAFYIGTFANIPLHGADANVGTNWDNGVTNSENSIVRISLKDLTGTGADCGFYSVVETFFPEPSSAAMLILGIIPMCRRRARKV